MHIEPCQPLVAPHVHWSGKRIRNWRQHDEDKPDREKEREQPGEDAQGPLAHPQARGQSYANSDERPSYCYG